MTELADHELLAQYAQNRREPAEAAFAALAERHVNLVYSTALRSVGNAHAAQEITQAVFIILANKAGKLSPRVVLSGWLYQTTRHTAANFLRGEVRRQKREQEAFMQSTLQETPAATAWPQIAPLLDSALGQLGERDRNAIVLRFFENKNLREIGHALGASEDAAKMRVNRALEKLRKFFNKRGAVFSAAAIASAVSANSVHAAPIGLATTISATAIARGAAASTTTLTLAKGALKIMAWSKMQTAIVAGAVILLAVVATPVTIREIHKHESYDAWRVRYCDLELLKQSPPQVRILPSKFRPGGCGSIDGAWMGIGADVETIVEDAYEPGGVWRTKFLTPLPSGYYDFIAKSPPGSSTEDTLVALQHLVKKKFGLMGHFETQEADVLVLEVNGADRDGLKISNSPTRSYSNAPGKFLLVNWPLRDFIAFLESNLHIPIIDRTGIDRNVDISLNYDQKDWGQPNPEVFKKAVLDQLGLELVPGHEPVQMLIVEKATD